HTLSLHDALPISCQRTSNGARAGHAPSLPNTVWAPHIPNKRWRSLSARWTRSAKTSAAMAWRSRRLPKSTKAKPRCCPERSAPIARHSSSALLMLTSLYRLLALAVATTALALPVPAGAQDFPDRAIHLVVPYPPGGT